MNIKTKTNYYKLASLPIVAIVLTIFSIGCGSPQANDKAKHLEDLKAQQAKLTTEIRTLEAELLASGQAGKDKLRNVGIGEVTTQNFTHFIEIQGKVEADQNVTVTSKMPGTVTRILAEIGQEVKAGQVLAEMDKESIAKGIDEVKNQLTFATDIFNRQQALWNQKIGSEIQFLQAKNNKESLEKRLVSLNEQLDMALIKAPISGVVDEVYARIGQPASPGAPSFRVVNFSNLKARAEVAEVNANKVKKGNSVLVIFPDIQDSVNGQISYASKVISPMTRTFFVEVPLKNGKVDYKPNSIAILKVSDYSNPKAITVPIRLVQNAEDGMYVLVAEEKDGKIVASKRVVTLGTSYNGVAEVKSGLAIGDKLINAGYQSVNVGDLLKVN